MEAFSIPIRTDFPRVDARRRQAGLALLVIAAAFLIVRVPLMYRLSGGQDEDYYAIPGWTILQDGVPRIPYVPSRDPTGVFFKADEILFALPPLYFYWQAAVYVLTGIGYGPGRLSSGLAGLIALWLIYRLARLQGGERNAALWGVGLFSVSRVFFFPATMARPDMLCAALALAGVLFTRKWMLSVGELARVRATFSPQRYLVAAGICCGLAMLTHPFAFVPCLQIGAMVLLRRAPWKHRLRDAALLVAIALATFALWLPLILLHLEVFKSQFFNNVLNRSGPGLLVRFLWPWESIAAQARLFLDHAGPIQAVLMAAGLFYLTWRAIRRGSPRDRFLVSMGWSAMYLMTVCQGTHPAKGYWCYPCAFLFIGIGIAIADLIDWAVARWSLPTRLAAFAAFLALLAVMAPGSGIRTFIQHVRHWSDADYNHQAFVRHLLEKTPREGRCLVDASYVLDYYLDGRSPTLALNIHPYFEAAGLKYDYLVVGPTGLAQSLPEQLEAELWFRTGQPGNPFACYAEVYRAGGDGLDLARFRRQPVQ